ncbi:recombinase family protein [Bacillus sp. FJAT-49711]|uniref:recombinase family protein n=1 Tax=Bacillus sp. FJAT-49711 TaxID=2833585 RepID=UPI001BC961EB|nr:recombinase family protein [Bacillus sp. FJAT-49711]MBS4220235.1 recombinase family protein [Bacillus sp. FJAT-49711]
MRVRIIEPTVKKESKKRVCAYARVSTDHEKQGESLENQISYYERMIGANPEYEFVGGFADRGISGTTENRPEFKRMLELANQGEIDLIITKSISRFARNTTVMLQTVRELKNIGVEIRFEKENINTLNAKGEVLLSILSSLAQDESRSISENSTWGIRRRFEQGKVAVNHTKFLGYDKDEDGNLIINENQAKIVRRIYKDYLDGKGPNRIARELEEENIPNWNGKAKWYEGSIRKMLSNEKYKGDALLQKTYTVDFLTKKRVQNTGQIPRYYVEESHPAIIPKDMWEAVQLEMERRRAFAEKHGIVKVDYATIENPFAGRVICGHCGSPFGRKVWNSTNETLRRKIWRCNKKYTIKGKKSCENKHIDDTTLYQAFIDVFNAILENKDHFLNKWREQVSDDLLKNIKQNSLLSFLRKLQH